MYYKFIVTYIPTNYLLINYYYANILKLLLIFIISVNNNYLLITKRAKNIFYLYEYILILLKENVDI